MTKGTGEILIILTIVFIVVLILFTAIAETANSICSESVHQLSNTITGSGTCPHANTSEIIQIQGLSYLHCKCPK